MEAVATSNGGLAVLVRLETPLQLAIERNQLRDATHDQRQMTFEKSQEVVARFAAEIEEPSSDENVVRISGQMSFEQQYEVFKQA